MIYFFEDFSLDSDRRELRRETKPIAVEPLVFDLLEYLIRSRDRVVSKDDLIAGVWNGRIVSESTLASRLNAARHAVGDSGEQQRLIRTLPRKGHRFVGEVRELQARDGSAIALPSGEPTKAGSSGSIETQAVTFCQTADGINIGVASAGTGPVLVRTAFIISHIEYEWDFPLLGSLLRRLAKRWRVVRYDGRGTGLSDRNVAKISFDTFLNDLEAVVDTLELERFALLGMSGGAAIAVAFAALHPNRISKLVLFGGYAQGRNKRTSPQSAEEANALLTMLRSGWGDEQSPFWRAWNSFFLPRGSPDQFNALMAYWRHASSMADSVKMRVAVDDIDVLHLTSKVTAPTIVFHCLQDKLVPFEQGRLLAASIQNAKFVALESENHMLLPNEPAWAKYMDEMEAFLVEGN